MYDIEADRTETRDLASEHPELVGELTALWDGWAARCGGAAVGRLAAAGPRALNCLEAVSKSVSAMLNHELH